MLDILIFDESLFIFQAMKSNPLSKLCTVINVQQLFSRVVERLEIHVYG